MSRPSTVAVVHFPSSGHIRPLLTLVAALEQEGLRIVQWAPPEWEQACLSAGGEFRELPEFLKTVAWPPPIPSRISEFVGMLAERMAPWMSEQVKDVGADVVLRDSFAQYGHYAALTNDLHEIVVPPMMAFHRQMRPSAADIPLTLKNLVKGIPGARRLRSTSRRLERQYGAPLGDWRTVFAGRHGATTLIWTTPSLQMRPEALRGEDIRYVGPLRALGPTEVESEPALEGLSETDQLIYVSLGTVFEMRPSFYRDAAAALAAPGRRVILSIGRIPPEEIGPLPPGVSAHAHVDQLSVLRRTDLFVAHGGFNGIQESLASGVPMLLFPQMFEQALNADVVVGQGAGLRIRSATQEGIRAAAKTLLSDPTYAEAARRIAAELRSSGGIDEAVEIVASAAREHSARVHVGETDQSSD
jgi:MGT family glycosyltransferase